MPTLTQIKALEQGTLDVGILRAPVHAEALKIKTLFFDPFVVVIPAANITFESQDALATYLKGSPFIFFNKDFAPNYNDKLLEICGRMGFNPNIMHEANNVHSILQLIEAGLGVSILPHSLKRQYGYLNVSFIELAHIEVNTEVVLAYKPTNRSAALTWFIAHYGA